MWREGRSEKERERGGGVWRETHTHRQRQTDKQTDRIGKIMKLILKMDKVLLEK